VRAAGKHARGEVCYTTSPVHTIPAFVKMVVELEKMGCHSIGIKDMSGVIAPRVAYDLVKELKRRVGLPITLHTHDTAGLGAAAYYAAIDAGVDAVETSIAPFANGTAQPDTVRMIAMLEGHPRCPKFDAAKLNPLRSYFTGVYKELEKFTSTANERVDSDTLCYQVPGGMLSNFRTQLKEQGMSDKFDQVLAEIPVVRAALGGIPLVTPTSQIVGTQAMLNVKFGRWKNLSQPAIDVALGKYGKTPGPIDPAVLGLALKKPGTKLIDCRPADLLAPRMPQLRAELTTAGLPADDEACVLHAMFPQEFAALHKKPATAAPAPAPAVTRGKTDPTTRYALTIEGRRVQVSVTELN
jgi:oxaloacetate decarboxylase alpha subunit/pyruvate carboxylase subunit B